MQGSIIEFLKENKVASICFTDAAAKPYCISCFYLFDETHSLLIFKSSYGTNHDALVAPEHAAAGTILPDSLDVLKIKGIQFSGTILTKQETETFKLSAQYTKKYPFSLTMPGYVWGIKLEQIKFTNNTLGFGNKMHWKRSDDAVSGN